MSKLRTIDPFFTSDFDAALRQFLRPVATDGTAPPLTMRVDISDTGEAYAVKADIPGVKREDIHVRIDGNVVQIDAEARREAQEKGNGDKVLRSERYHGQVSRTFSLDDDIDDTRAEAHYTDGVLTLQLPKKPAAATRKIEVR